ncbi:MAG TPA: diacylglycerol kinase family protein [Bryobacteraceae bacterium]|nr:diacylglycerol kinase family protein [Bryobacteraceae bacterium]
MATPGTSPLAVIINRSSGWDDTGEGLSRVESILRTTQVSLVKKGTNCEDVARRVVAEGARTVVAGGGDGTIRAVAEALTGTGVNLGVIPVGTLNHFARDLDIPLDLDQAASLVRDGTPRAVDTGEVNGRVFINNAIIGLYPAFRAERAEEERKGAAAPFAVAGAALRVFRRNPALLFRMTLDGREIVRRSPLVVVANNEHKMEGWQLGTRTRMDAGRLWIYVMREKGHANLLATFASVLAGTFDRNRHFEVFSVAEAVLSTGRKRIRVSLDGEIVELDAPLKFRSRPKALKVIAPPQGRA